jgi:tyrosyl-tRNA synthetase
VTKKIRKAFTAPKIIEGNGLFAFAEFVLLPAAGMKGRRELVIDRSRDGLEPLVYSSMDKMREDYQNDVVSALFKFKGVNLTHSS